MSIGTWTEGGDAPQPDAPENPSRVPAWAWWLVLAITLVVLGGVGALIWTNASSGDAAEARATAQEYVDAVAEGDAETANEIGRVPGRDQAGELLRSDALDEADELISRVDVGRLRVDTDRGTATGTVEYELDGRRYTDRIELSRDADGWHVRDGLVVELPLGWGAENAPLKIAGFDEVLMGYTSFDAYPAVYRVEAPNDFFEVVGDGRLVAASTPDNPFGRYDSPTGDEAWTEPTDAYWDEVQRQTDAWYDDCAEQQTVADLRVCGIEFDVPDGDLRTELDVEVVRYPSVYEDYGWEWTELGTDGEFVARYTTDSGDEREVRGTNGYADATIEIASDGELEVRVSSY